jgi:hypothetical protein
MTKKFKYFTCNDANLKAFPKNGKPLGGAKSFGDILFFILTPSYSSG